jgi:hypothetical protein
MARQIHWGRVTCPYCHDRITNNALGRDAHIRHCKGRKPEHPEDAELRRRFAGDTASRDPHGKEG